MQPASTPLHSLEVPPFVPPRLMASGHAQTVVASYLPAPAIGPGELVRVDIEGGHIRGRLHRAPRPARRASCVAIVHGIAGTAEANFVRRTAHLALGRGLDALRLDLRGAGESHDCGGAVAPLYHAGLTDDVRAALALLASRYERVHAVGFSLGGQLVLRALGEWGAEAPRALASATAVSPPLDLADCADFAERRAATLYRYVIVRELKTRYGRARGRMGARFTAAAVRDVRTIRQYDEAVVAPYFGFQSAADYYARASAEAVLDAICVPTLVLHAHDDPLVGVAPALRVAAQRRDALRVVTTQHGGHVGFYAARPARGDETRFWAEQRAIDLACATTR